MILKYNLSRVTLRWTYVPAGKRFLVTLFHCLLQKLCKPNGTATPSLAAQKRDVKCLKVRISWPEHELWPLEVQDMCVLFACHAFDVFCKMSARISICLH